MRIRWHVRTVETAGQSTWSSLAFSPSGQPAIAYYSSLNSALRFATLNPDGSWAISTVDTVASDCKPSLAFRSGRPAISYRVGANEFWGALRFALYTGGSSPWSISSVAPYGECQLARLRLLATGRHQLLRSNQQDAQIRQARLARSLQLGHRDR